MKRSDVTVKKKQIRERLERVNLVLRTLRNVDQVIFEELDRKRLIKGVCKSLVATRGYYNAWVLLLDKSRRYKMTAESGLGDAFRPLVEMLKREGLPPCGLQALEQSNAVVVRNPVLTCTDCPLSGGYRGRGGIASRLYYRRKLYGFLCASVPSSLVEEKEECSLFEKIARDVAFALHKISLEEAHQRAEGALWRSENRYRALFDNASDAILVRDLEGTIIMANAAMAVLSGYPITELYGMNISEILTANSYRTAMTQQRINIRPFPQRYELRLVRKDSTERIIEVVSNLLEGGDVAIVQEIARDITTQKLAQENLRAYADQAIVVQEEERKRIARELHDETAQALASLGMDIGSLAKNKELSLMQISRSLKTLRTKTEVILEGVRDLSEALRPPMLEEFGLLASLSGLVNKLDDQQQIVARFDVEGTARRLTPDAEIAMYRVAQEALSNVKKHGEASECSLVMRYSPIKVVLEIRDNGRGFVLPKLADNLAYSGKLGLAGMQERTKLIGGKLTIKSRPGKGTVLRLELPAKSLACPA
ncbi:PAS domain S-box protein [Chloroflexota bacterium]